MLRQSHLLSRRCVLGNLTLAIVDLKAIGQMDDLFSIELLVLEGSDDLISDDIINELRPPS